MISNVYPNDDPDTAAKKVARDLRKEGWRISTENKQKPKTYTAYKYSKEIPLAEEITLGNRNVFLQIIDGNPVITTELSLTDKNIIVKPHERSENTPIIPYSFKDEDEIKYFIAQAKKETIHSLYYKSKSLWNHFVVAKDNDTITLLAVDQVYSHFQDLFSTTHYDMITGSPGSGKGAILATMKLLGYRVVLASDMSGANLLDIFGSVESGQVVLAEDEFDDIDKDEIKKKLIKVGYDDEGMVPRNLDGNTSNRHNEWYYIFGYKILAAENRLESKSLGGLNDRIFQIESIKSSPKFLIKTVRKEMRKPIDKQNPRYKDIIAKINYLRKLLLVYRILHHEDIIDEVNLNIDGRAWELTSPQIFLFNSKTLAPAGENERPALKEVLKMLSRFLQKKGELTKKTLEGVVHEALEKELFSNTTPKTLIDVNGKTINAYTISHREIIDKVIQLTDGTPSTTPNEQALYSTEYEKVTYKRILKICRERFEGYNDTIGTGDKKERALTFDEEIVKKVGKTFELISEIKIVDTDKDDRSDMNNIENWNIPFPSPPISSSEDRPSENTQNHTQNEEAGTLGRRSGVFEDDREDKDRDQFLKWIDELKSKGKQGNDASNALYPENRSISVPSSQNDGLFRCYHNGCKCNHSCNFETDNIEDYEKHGVKHLGNPLLYPSKAEMERYGLKPQRKEWEEK
jgi:hypothetical protein